MKPDLAAIKARAGAASDNERHRRAVQKWMSEEGSKGRLRQNDQAPAWADYERTLTGFDAFQDAAPGDVVALVARVEELEAALRDILEEAELQAMRGIWHLASQALEGK